MGQEKTSLRANYEPKFYMFSFPLNGICAKYAFPGMNWNLTHEEKFLVYFHWIVLSESSFIGIHEKLVEHFFAAIF